MSSQKNNILKEKKNFKDVIFPKSIDESNIDTQDDILFDGCNFESESSFNLINTTGRIVFINCTFKKQGIIKDFSCQTIEFRNCTFNTKWTLQNGETSSLTISQSTGREIFINGNYLDINISKNKINIITVKDVNVIYTLNESHINFEENTIDSLDIKSIKNYSAFKFLGGVYKSILLIGEFNETLFFDRKSLEIENLWIESSTLKKRIDFVQGKYKNVYFHRSNFEHLILIHDFDIIKKRSNNKIHIENISIHSNIFDKNIILSTSVDSINISNNKFNEIFNFNGNYYKNTETKSTDISIDGVNSGNIVFENVECYIYINVINFGNIYFKDIKALYLTITDTQNNGIISFTNIHGTQLMAIEGSNIGRCEFLNTNFENFNEIIIAESNISNISFSNYFFHISSFSRNPKMGYGIKNKKDNNNNLRKIYNQLKKTAFNKGEIDAAFKFQALEYKYLFREKSIYKLDKFLLLLNYISNDNGYSWFRGIIFTLTISFITFTIYCKYTDISISFQNFILYISSFPKLQINEAFSWKIELITWIGRIFIGYGIYQTIAAFRKYGKT